MTADLFAQFAALDPATRPEATPDWDSVAPVLLAAIDERNPMSTQQLEPRPRGAAAGAIWSSPQRL